MLYDNVTCKAQLGFACVLVWPEPNLDVWILTTLRVVVAVISLPSFAARERHATKVHAVHRKRRRGNKRQAHSLRERVRTRTQEARGGARALRGAAAFALLPGAPAHGGVAGEGTRNTRKKGSPPRLSAPGLPALARCGQHWCFRASEAWQRSRGGGRPHGNGHPQPTGRFARPISWEEAEAPRRPGDRRNRRAPPLSERAGRELLKRRSAPQAPASAMPSERSGKQLPPTPISPHPSVAAGRQACIAKADTAC